MYPARRNQAWIPSIFGDLFDDFNDNDEELVIALEKKHEDKEEKKGENYLRREFSYTSYHQAFTLPDNIAVEDIKATMNNGILGIELPKKTPDKQIPASRHIAIA